MEDEARLIVELLDRSGSSGAAATNPAQPGAADVPGSTLAADFQKKVTEQGAGASAGAGSAPAPPPAASVPSLPPAGNPVSGTPTVAPSSSVTPTGDPLLSTVRGIVQADPNATTEEIQKALGITAERATDLINAARGNTSQAPAPTPPSGPPAPPTMPPPAPAPSGEPDKSLERFAQQIRESVMTQEERYNRQVDRLKEARDAKLIEPEEYQRAVQTEQDKYLAALNKEQERRLKPPPPPDEEPEAPPLPSAPEPIGADEAANAAARIFGATGAPLLGAFGGPLGRAGAGLAQTVIGNLPALLPVGTQAGALGGLVAAAGPVVATAGIAAAGVGVVGAAIAATANEAERARRQISDLSPEVARAQSEADVRQVFANMRTAQTLGDEVSQYVRQSSRLSTEFQRSRDVIAEPAIRELNTLLKVLTGVLDGFNKASESPAFREGISGAVRSGIDAALPPGWGTWLRKLAGMIEDDKVQAGSPITWFGEQPFLKPPPPFDSDSKDIKTIRDETRFDAPLPGLTL